MEQEASLFLLFERTFMRLSLFRKKYGELEVIHKEVIRDEEAERIVEKISPSSKITICELTDSRGLRCSWELCGRIQPKHVIVKQSARYRGENWESFPKDKLFN